MSRKSRNIFRAARKDGSAFRLEATRIFQSFWRMERGDKPHAAEPPRTLQNVQGEHPFDQLHRLRGFLSSAIARLAVPIIKPKAYLPVHWYGLYAPVGAGMPRPYSLTL